MKVIILNFTWTSKLFIRLYYICNTRLGAFSQKSLHFFIDNMPLHSQRFIALDIHVLPAITYWILFLNRMVTFFAFPFPCNLSYSTYYLLFNIGSCSEPVYWISPVMILGCFIDCILTRPINPPLRSDLSIRQICIIDPYIRSFVRSYDHSHQY